MKSTSFAFAFVAALAGCGSKSPGGDTDAGNSGDDAAASRCSQLSCPNLCSETLGCMDCDPTAGSATCNGSDVVACNADGSFGSTIESCGEGMTCDPMGATCMHACTADGVDLIYAVDEANDFLSFDPRKLPNDPYTKIGTLSCPTTGKSLEDGGAALPMSMSVDRNGLAWVEYTSGEVFNVSLTDASCTASAWVAKAGGMQLFGMGFSTDTSGGNTETLFLAGGGSQAEPNGKLAWVDPADNNLTPTVLGSMAQSSSSSPELTGTSDAKLYGFFPVLSTPAYVQEIDKTTAGAVGNKLNLGTSGLGNGIRDWAFAQWGGVFYIFVTTSDSSNHLTSTVRSINRATGAYSVVLTNPTFAQVDGAGVSTCAPITIQ